MERYYTVDIYGSGNKEEIINSLRELADLMEADKEDKSLDGDGYDAINLRMDLTEE